jgi:hypothetical protein
MSTISGLRQELDRRIRDLRAQIRALADAITAVNDKTRRAAGTVTFGSSPQTVAVVWSKPFPDDQYGVWYAIYTTSPAQVHAVPLPATRTAGGISFSVTAAAAVGDVTLDVFAERSA